MTSPTELLEANIAVEREVQTEQLLQVTEPETRDASTSIYKDDGSGSELADQTMRSPGDDEDLLRRNAAMSGGTSTPVKEGAWPFARSNLTPRSSPTQQRKNAGTSAMETDSPENEVVNSSKQEPNRELDAHLRLKARQAEEGLETLKVALGDMGKEVDELKDIISKKVNPKKESLNSRIKVIDNSLKKLAQQGIKTAIKNVFSAYSKSVELERRREITPDPATPNAPRIPAAASKVEAFLQTDRVGETRKKKKTKSEYKRLRKESQLRTRFTQPRKSKRSSRKVVKRTPSSFFSSNGLKMPSRRPRCWRKDFAQQSQTSH